MERIGGEVGRELSRFGPVGSMADLVAAWPEVVGEAIARNAWPARVARDGTLHVHTVDAVWAFELTQHASEIAPRLGVPRLRFAPGPLPEAGGEVAPEGSSSVVEAGPEEVERAAELAAPIEDEELRALVARAVAASLARGASDRVL